MQKLTEDAAIRLFRKQWDWLYHNPEMEKDDIPPEIIEGWDIRDVSNGCFLCEYNDQNPGNCGSNCLVKWPENDKGCEKSQDSPWQYWRQADTTEDCKRYAKLIRDLPRRKPITKKDVTNMKELVDGSRPLTRKAVVTAMIEDDLFFDSCAVKHWQGFENWCSESFSPTATIHCPAGKNKAFYKRYLIDRVSVKEWLVKHNFLEWKESPIQYSTDGRSGTVKLELHDYEDGTVQVRAPGKENGCLIDFRDGRYSLYAGTSKEVAEVSTRNNCIMKNGD